MSARRANVAGRVAALEHRAGRADARCRSCAAVTLFLPRKDGNTRPLGTEMWPGGVTVVWYRAEHRNGSEGGGG